MSFWVTGRLGRPVTQNDIGQAAIHRPAAGQQVFTGHRCRNINTVCNKIASAAGRSGITMGLA
jgi:hypothetical protein